MQKTQTRPVITYMNTVINPVISFLSFLETCIKLVSSLYELIRCQNWVTWRKEGEIVTTLTNRILMATKLCVLKLNKKMAIQLS